MTLDIAQLEVTQEDISQIDVTQIDLTSGVDVAGSAPDAPSALSATPTSDTEITVGWTDNSDDEDSFIVERRTTSGPGAWGVINTAAANATGYSDTGLTGDTSYDYRVLARNAFGDSAYTAIVAGVTGPAVPSALTATATGETTIDLAWTDNSSTETSFRIERRIGAGAWSEVDTAAADAVSYNDTGLTAATQYGYRIRARNAAAIDSAYTSEATDTTTVAAPTAPSAVVVTITSPTEATIDWTDNSATEVTFRIEQRTGAGAWSEIDSTAAGVVTLAVTGLTAATQYGWRVKARNAGGDSAYASEATGTTDYAVPQTGLELDFDPDFIPDADAATVTTCANQAPGSINLFNLVIGTPTVVDGVIAKAGAVNAHRVLRCAPGDNLVEYTADASHSDAASVYAVAQINTEADLTNGIVALYQSSIERNAFFFRHTFDHIQGFWNNETSWLHASSSQPTINVGTLYTRGWTVTTASKTIVDLRYYGNDGGTPVEEVETSQPDNGMEEFAFYQVGWAGSSTGDFQGDIVRVLVYSVVHTPSEAAAIVAGLRTMYGST